MVEKFGVVFKPATDFQHFFATLDCDGNGSVSFKEFTSVVKKTYDMHMAQHQGLNSKV